MLFAVLLTVLVLAAAADLRTERIPNWITYSGACAGLLIAASEGSLAFHLAGLAIGLGLGVLASAKITTGGGDAKLLGAIGALAGPLTLIATCAALISLLFGWWLVAAVRKNGVVATARLLFPSILAEQTTTAMEVLEPEIARRRVILGPWICAAALVAVVVEAL